MSTVTRAADTVLDRTLLGYSSVGHFLRRRWWPADPAPDALAGKVAVVTGAKAGLGKATAVGLAKLGATVRIAVRGDGDAARAEIERAAPGARIIVDQCDLSLISSVRDYAKDLDGEIDVLIHNAGLMPAERTETAEGNEVMLATHVLGPHLLTASLRPKFADGARVIWVSSGGMYGQPLRTDDLQYLQGEYKPAAGYARTKRMQVVLAELWADELDGSAVTVHGAHPGWADTPGVATSLPTFQKLTRPILRTPEQGADTFVWLAAAEEPGRYNGMFWHDRVQRPTHYLGKTRETAAQRQELWQACGRLTGS
ncbi:SDR family NAD(P)-dependent oxidoreductase [Amycolatopsis sp. BJA-103]|uniref:SDR family NAD(P)-dependent oxidoreductase n=1 Tax=Amycolatopsis sp. BJA-103 TaxID=1911175 RepID=UPI000C78AB91|nr:SDR family NAD(P)-dependent oxidoreductase [Amycolatopsis sp. BJA-103]AUI60443.1 dehydrogenase [Amycolatopsis sp. BJA-103]PNE16468.1 dehydrogenase [Amycolatopsis sp. BJA-103]